MTIKLPIMESEERKDFHLLLFNRLYRIAFKGGNYSYIAPFQQVYMNHTLYFHFTDDGRKMKLIQWDNRVCVEIQKLGQDLSAHIFVSLREKLEVVEDPKERSTAIQRITEDENQKISRTLLTAHSLNPENGESTFTPDKPFIIVKLKPIEEKGIKIPVTHLLTYSR